MSKPYSDEEFSKQITDDRSWRLKEISDLKTALNRADTAQQRVLLRALVAICYAHWEGYVRFAARKYLQYVALRKMKYKELDPQFFRNYFLPRLGALSKSNTSMADRCSLIEAILTSSNLRYSRSNEDLVNTKSNLNFEAFSEICLVCGLPTHTFSDNEAFVDIFLLKRRNGIAHGEDTLVAVEDLDELTNTTIALMRAFGDALENRVALRSYRSS